VLAPVSIASLMILWGTLMPVMPQNNLEQGRNPARNQPPTARSGTTQRR
jgi:hypothetical protein